MRRGSLIILSGPSGVGKGTVRKLLSEDKELNFYYSISMTTRKMRAGEENGRDYFFVTPEEFKENVSRGNLLEWAEFVGNCYGTPADVVNSYRDKGTDVLLEIETNGARQVIEKCPDAITIFLVPPSFQALEDRIRGRSTEDEATIQKRLNKAKQELKLADQYKHVVINDKIENAAQKIKDIILSARK